MKKYFITSDTHSFYTPLKQALKESGFDKDNPDHIFVLCGDLFDRGDESVKIYKFVKSLPKERRILIRGNHEYLLRDLLNKKMPDSWDFSNGTVKTVCEFTDSDLTYIKYTTYFDELEHQGEATWTYVAKKMKRKSVLKWIFSDEWVDYFELKDYIFVHSFIPLDDKPVIEGLPSYYDEGHNYSYNPNWRETKDSVKWEDSTWGCPWKLYLKGLFDEEIKNNKTLVVGHWHSSDFYSHLDGYKDEEIKRICPTYFGKNIIALDACTVLSGRCNIFVVEEE